MICMYVCMYVLRNGVTLIPSPPRTRPPEVPTVAGNTQADDALYWGKGRCKLSDHTWAAYQTVQRCPTPPPRQNPQTPRPLPPPAPPPPPPVIECHVSTMMVCFLPHALCFVVFLCPSACEVVWHVYLRFPIRVSIRVTCRWQQQLQ